MATKRCVLSMITFTTMAVVQTVAVAGPVRPVPLEELVTKSDVVATGFVTSVTPQGRTIVHLPGGRQFPGRLFAAEIAVTQILKGSGDASVLRCEFAVPDVAVGFRPLPPSRDILIFLIVAGDHYELASPYFSFLPTVLVPEVRGAAPIARVIGVLDAVLDSSSASIQDKGEILDTLSRSTAPSARAVLRKNLGSDDMNLRLWAAAGLIRLDDVAALKVAADVLMDPPNAVEPDMIQRLNWAVGFGIKSAGAIPSLSRLLAANDVETRRAAAAALRRTAAPDAISALIAALSDTDTTVQYSAVMGLSKITGKTAGATSMEHFRENPAPLIAYWRNWAKNR